MGEAEDQPGGINLADDVQGLVEGVRHRLVADDIEAAVEGCQGISMMTVVRGHDGDDLGTVLAPILRIEHGDRVGVGAGGIDPHRRRGISGSLGIGRDHPCHQLVATVEPCGRAVHRADEAARATPDHCQAKRTAKHLDDRLSVHRDLLQIDSEARPAKDGPLPQSRLRAAA
jgi:hypothetical protein